MALLKTRFDYAKILIGDEVIYRGLNQQQAYADKGEYGMSWNSATDGPIRTNIRTQANAMKTNDFNDPGGTVRSCPVDPPCPWPKDSYDLQADLLMPMMMPNDGGTTYNIKVAKQTGSASTVYQIGDTLASYDPDQSKLDPTMRSRFLYYERSNKITYLNDAIIVIEKLQQGIVVNTFTYLFKLI